MQTKFKKGIFLNILNLDKRQWQKDIDFIKNIPNLDHLEIWLETKLSPKDIIWLKEKLSNYKLIIHAPFTSLSLISGHELINKSSISILKKFIDQSIALGAQLITIHTGKYPVYSNSSKASNVFVKNFQELISHANGKIILTTENMPITRGAENHFPLLEELDNLSSLIPSINYTLDVGHCLQNGEDYYEFIKNNKNRIKNIHLHNGVKNGKAHYGLHLPGDLNIKQFINFLNDINYQDFLTLEVLADQDKVESIKLL